MVRVEREMTRHLARLIKQGELCEDIEASDAQPTADRQGKTSVAFCYFSRVTNRYHRLSAKQVDAILSEEWESAVASRPTQNARQKPRQFIANLEATVRRLLPPEIAEGIAAFVRRQRGKPGSRFAKLASLGLSEWGGSTLSFSSDDVYMSFGADFVSKDIPILSREKQLHHPKILLCVYDLIPIIFPHLLPESISDGFSEYVHEICQTADTIVSISETTARDLSEFIRKSELVVRTDIQTVILGDDAVTTNSSSIDQLIHVDYILYVSTIEVRKNHATLLRAWERLADNERLTSHRLVFVGMQGWSVNDMISMMSRNPKLRDRVLVLGNVSDDELAWLYRNAAFSVFPSIYEGWGLGVCESLRYGTPVLISDAPALSEAAQNLMPVLPWDSPEAWYKHIELLLSDPAELDALRQAARHYRQRSWADFCNEVMLHARNLHEKA
jgi:glycosyltransferase involved in cell wall biosynthesis